MVPGPSGVLDMTTLVQPRLNSRVHQSFRSQPSDSTPPQSKATPPPPLSDPGRQAAGTASLAPGQPWSRGGAAEIKVITRPGSPMETQQQSVTTDPALLGNPRGAESTTSSVRNPEFLVDQLSRRCRTPGPFHIKKSQSP